MKCWKWSTWNLVWGFFLLVGGMFFYTGYVGTIYFSSQERTPMITKEIEQAALAQIEQDVMAEETTLFRQAQVGRMTSDDQTTVTSSFKNDQEIQREQTIKDFPSPVQGSPLRHVGNYYFEDFDVYRFHAGIDYAEPEGTVIRVTHGGKVIFSGPDPILGQKVTLDCGEGWLVTYGGLVNLRVQVGETVETQDALGQVGLFTAAESESDQPQLHYEVWHGNEVQTPARHNL
jgi:murein DD-endopeptidase MepM/ murein hydrolase activator NlpD